MSYQKLDDETLRDIKNNKYQYKKIKNEHDQFKNLLDKTYDWGLSDMVIKNPDGTIIDVDKSIQHIIFSMMNNRVREISCLLRDIDNLKDS